MKKLNEDQHRARRRDHAQRGANLVEMALILPLLALLLFGVVDIGRAFHTYITITNAAREGARRGSRIPGREDLVRVATITEAANSGIDLAGPEALITVGNVDGAPRTPISVTVDYTFTTFIGGLVGLPELHLRTDTEMVIIGE